MELHSPITDSVISLIKSLPPELQRGVGHIAQFVQYRHLHKKDNEYGEWASEGMMLASLPAL